MIAPKKKKNRSSKINVISIDETGGRNLGDRIRSSIGQASYVPDQHALEMGVIGASAMMPELSPLDLGRLRQFGYGLGAPVTLLTGLPVQPDMPPTPMGFGDDSAVQELSLIHI